jgi:NADPH:quinone reductase-like Zn-dependent oxidoreductase
MKAVGYYVARPIDRRAALVDLNLPDPAVGARDLLVHVRAVSDNPVDTKGREFASPPKGTRGC